MCTHRPGPAASEVIVIITMTENSHLECSDPEGIFMLMIGRIFLDIHITKWFNELKLSSNISGELRLYLLK